MPSCLTQRSKDAKKPFGFFCLAVSRRRTSHVGYVQRSPAQRPVIPTIHQVPFIPCERFKPRTAEHTGVFMSHAKEQRRQEADCFLYSSQPEAYPSRRVCAAVRSSTTYDTYNPLSTIYCLRTVQTMDRGTYRCVHVSRKESNGTGRGWGEPGSG